MHEAGRNNPDPPHVGRSVNPAGFAPVLGRRLPDQGAKTRAESSQARIPHSEADIGHGVILLGEQAFRLVNSQMSQKLVGRLAECAGKKAMKVEGRRVRILRGLL